MILQTLLFQNTAICDREKMYYNVEGNTIFCMEKQYCLLEKGAKCKGNTYFNSFSIGKWKKYTIINNLFLKLTLKGTFLVRVCHVKKINNQIADSVITEITFKSDKRGSIEIPIAIEEETGLYYFELISLEEKSEYWGGYFGTNIQESQLENIKIAIGICTFRREKYVEKNLEILTNEIIKNINSPLYEKVEIFISDNGKSLKSNLNNKNIHIFPNKNLGGAGGFTRAMIEIMKVREEKKITHVLLMDDDIRINPDSLLRTYTMLSLLKPQYKDAFIGGHMLKIDSTNVQSEAADHWDIVTHHPVKYNYDLENLNYVIKNEIEDSVNYLSWWYCCMPVDVINSKNLPLPIFIKRDDIEYGLRNGKNFICLNGICVWHEPFEYKNASYLEYYYFRNMCIMNSKHRLSFNQKRLLQEVKKRVRTSVLRYRYKEAELSLLGIQDFLKGIDWLKEQDGESLNAAIMKLGYKKEPIEEIDWVFTHGILEKNLVCKEGKLKKILRVLTANGWLLSANRNVTVPSYQPSTALFYRAKRILNYEEVSRTGFITHKDYHALYYIYKMYRKTKKMIKKDFDRVILEYRDRYDELINLEFWNKYLYGEGKKSDISSGLDKEKKPGNKKYQYKEIILSNILYLIQGFLVGLPVKKNRVMLYVHDRKGFTCNPKYVTKKLIENFGEKLEIIWVTMHPESCKEIEELGVNVIKSNSYEHIKKYFRTRFYITNDSFPTWALHRWNQKWLNVWHGAMNYKHIGYDYLAPMSKLGDKIFRMRNREPDFYLAGSEFFAQDTSESFRMDRSIFISTGLPRNDIFFEIHNELNEKIRKDFGIKDSDKIVLFAPTFRRGMKSNTYGMDFEVLRNVLHGKFGGNWVILFRNHNFVKGKQNYYNGAIDVSGYNDMQELLYIADVLISDYSSCMYDYSFTKKPCFVYASDLENYINNDRAFAFPIEKWPYPIAKNNKELVENILKFNHKEYIQKVEVHHKEVGAFDNGTASLQVARIVEKYCL